MKKLMTILTISTLLLGCDKHVLKDYYFQMKDFDQSKTYIYVDQNNPDNILHFKMYYKIIDSDTIFTSETLNPDGKPNEVFVEKIDNSKSTMTDYYFVSYDNQGNPVKQVSDKIKTEVYSYSPNSYPLIWKVKIGKVNNSQIVTKKRSIIKEDTTINVMNKPMNCVVFKDELVIESENDSTKFYQESYYAKGLGLVGYERFIEDNYVMNYKLKEIK